jgi:hypothetical protein
MAPARSLGGCSCIRGCCKRVVCRFIDLLLRCAMRSSFREPRWHDVSQRPTVCLSPRLYERVRRLLGGRRAVARYVIVLYFGPWYRLAFGPYVFFSGSVALHGLVSVAGSWALMVTRSCIVRMCSLFPDIKFHALVIDCRASSELRQRSAHSSLYPPQVRALLFYAFPYVFIVELYGFVTPYAVEAAFRFGALFSYSDKSCNKH